MAPVRAIRDFPSVIGGRRVASVFATNTLDAMLLVCRDLARDWESAIEGEMGNRHKEHLLGFILVKNHLAHDSAFVACIEGLGDLALRGDFGGGSPPSQIGYQRRGRERRKWHYFSEPAEEPLNLVLIVDHLTASLIRGVPGSYRSRGLAARSRDFFRLRLLADRLRRLRR